jgi:serine/threonine protein kinase
VQYITCAIPYCKFMKRLSESVYDETASTETKAANSELLDTLLKEPQQEVEIDDPAPDASPTRKSDEVKKPDNGKKAEEGRHSEDGKEEQKARTHSASVKEPGKNLMQELENDHEVFDSPNGERVNFSSFNILEKIGAGAFGQIFKVQLASTGQIFAMKSISKGYLFKTKQLKYALTECKLLKQVDHQFVIKMHYAFQTPKYLYFILDFCAGGDLSMHLANRELFDENEARFYVAELILAIEYLHHRNIIYRDLKPDNILLGTFLFLHVPSLRRPHQALRLRPRQRNVRPDGAGDAEFLWESGVLVA